MSESPENSQTSTTNKAAGERSRGALDRLLIEASHILNLDLELNTLLKNISSILTDYLQADASAILLFGSPGRRADLFTYAEGRSRIIEIDAKAKDEGAAGLVIDSNKPLIINEFAGNENLQQAIGKRLNISCRNLMAAPIVRGDNFLGVIEVFNKKDGSDFGESDLEIMNALGEQIALAVANAKLLRRAQRKGREAQSLYEVGKMMSATIELEEILKIIVAEVSRLVRVNVATIYIVDPVDGSIKDIVWQGVPESYKTRLTLKIGQGICGWVAKTGQSVVLNDVSENKQYIQMRPETKSEIAVPLIAQDKVIGVFNVESDELNAYSQADLELLETFGSQAAVSIERALLYKEAMERKSFAEQLAVARRIQETFFPKNAPVIAGFDIAGVNIPSEAVGGDYYDFIDIVQNQIGLAIGDVSGKGLGAALIMAAFRASLKAEIRNNFAIRTIFGKVNSLLFESIERENYVTSVYGVLDTKNSVFTFSNAGHNPPLLFKAKGGIMELIEGGLALGMFPDSVYEERAIYIEKNECLLFYTDGVTEALDSVEQEFGLDRLKQLVGANKTLAAHAIIEKVFQAVQRHRDAGKPTDDLTMILVRRLT